MCFGCLFRGLFYPRVVYHSGPYEERNAESAMEILNKRYARGEINRDEFERIKKDLR
jgi:uncharacterized membrane protein